MMDPEYILTLFVTGQTPTSLRTIANLQAICESELAGRYTTRVIDILKEPALAEEQKIIATPTLIKELPEPLRRIVGDLSDRQRVLFGLDLVPSGRT